MVNHHTSRACEIVFNEINFYRHCKIINLVVMPWSYYIENGIIVKCGMIRMKSMVTCVHWKKSMMGEKLQVHIFLLAKHRF